MTGPDPVEEFFSSERASVHPLATDDAHWASLVTESRRQRSTRVLSYAAGGAAALVLVGTVGWFVTRPDDNGTVAASPTTSTTSSTSTRPSPTSSPSSTRTTSPTSTATATKPVTTTVPKTFQVLSVSQADEETVYALGNGGCPKAACPALAKSTDDGKTWLLVSNLTKSSTASRHSTLVGTDSSVIGVRFASPKVGWAFGGDIKRTTDGGRTWTEFATPGKSVVGLETDGTNVAIATSTGSCDGTSCDGDLGVSVTPATSTSVSGTPVDVAGTGATRSVSFAWQAGTPFITAARAKGSTAAVVTPKGASELSLPGCTSPGQPVQVVQPGAGSTLYAVCSAGGAAGSIGYATYASSDGATWTKASDSLLLVNAGQTSFAASDASHLLGVSGGSADLHGAMKVSSDRGETWHDPASPPALPDRGWAWVGSPGRGLYYAIPVAPTGSYWASSDHGEHWTEVKVAKP